MKLTTNILIAVCLSIFIFSCSNNNENDDLFKKQFFKKTKYAQITYVPIDILPKKMNPSTIMMTLERKLTEEEMELDNIQNGIIMIQVVLSKQSEEMSVEMGKGEEAIVIRKDLAHFKKLTHSLITDDLLNIKEILLKDNESMFYTENVKDMEVEKDDISHFFEAPYQLIENY